MGAILDAVSAGNFNSQSSSLSWSHVLGSGPNPMLIVCVEGEYNSGTPQVNGITYNGIALTKIQGSNATGGSNNVNFEMWALWGATLPAPGTYTIAVNWSGNVNKSQAGGAISFFNIKPQTAEATSVIGTAAVNPLVAAITTLTPNALLVTCYGSQNTPGAASSTGDTLGFNSVPGTAEKSECDGFYRIVTSPSSTSVSLSVTNPESQGMVVASFATISTSGFLGILK